MVKSVVGAQGRRASGAVAASLRRAQFIGGLVTPRFVTVVAETARPATAPPRLVSPTETAATAQSPLTCRRVVATRARPFASVAVVARAEIAVATGYGARPFSGVNPLPAAPPVGVQMDVKRPTNGVTRAG